MPTFIYEAIDQDGMRHRGELIVPTREKAAEALAAQRLSLISLSAKGGEKISAMSLSFFERIGTIDKVLLARHMSVMIKAGLGIADIIAILIGDAEKNVMRKFLEQAKRNLERGQQLSQTFEAYPKFFSPVFVGLVRAGEMSGNLEQTLDRLSVQIHKEYELTRRTIGVMIYPAILLFASVILVTFLLAFVVPKISNAFIQVGVPLPLLTRIFIGASDLLTSSPLIPIMIPVAFIAFSYFFFGSKAGRTIISEALWRVPLTKNLIKKLALARFSRTLGTLLQAGLTIIESLEITAEAVGNARYRRSILATEQDIKKGLPLTDAFKQTPLLFPHLLTSMMAVGEKTGNLEELLITVSEFYEDDADRLLKTLVTLLEPTLLLFMGMIVGGIALSIMLPIYQLVGSLK